MCVMSKGKGGATSVTNITGLFNTHHFYVIKDGHISLYETVSTDQWECTVKGRLLNIKGGESIIHVSSKINRYHQVSLRASDNIGNKEFYEQSAEVVGVKILV